MNKIVIALALGASCIGSAAAQGVSDVWYDGRWSAVVQRNDGTRQTGTLVISNFGGTWSGSIAKDAATAKRCRARRFTITLQESNANQVALTIWGSPVSPGCPDVTMDLAPETPRKLVGDFDEIGKVTLTKH